MDVGCLPDGSPCLHGGGLSLNPLLINSGGPLAPGISGLCLPGAGITSSLHPAWEFYSTHLLASQPHMVSFLLAIRVGSLLSVRKCQTVLRKRLHHLHSH